MRPASTRRFQFPDDLLRAADGEGRDEEDAVVVGHDPNRLGQQADRLRLRFVLPAAIGGLDEDVVRRAHRRGVPQDRRAGRAQVAGEDEGAGRMVGLGLDLEPDDGGAQDVPGARKVAVIPGATSTGCP